MYYYGARYYAAWLCRFISTDPLKDDYPYYTSYQYAGNKPINSIDVDGLEPDPKTDTGGQGKKKEFTIESGNADFDKVANKVIKDFGLENVEINITNVDGDISGSISVNGKTANFTSDGGFSTNVDGNQVKLNIGENGNLLTSDQLESLESKPDGLGLLGATSDVAKGLDSGLNQRFQLEPARGDTETGIRDTKAGRIKKGKPVGEWAIRVDADDARPHAKVKGPHININP